VLNAEWTSVEQLLRTKVNRPYEYFKSFKIFQLLNLGHRVNLALSGCSIAEPLVNAPNLISAEKSRRSSRPFWGGEVGRRLPQ